MLDQAGEGSIGELFAEVLTDSIHLHHPRYVGHQVCAPVPLGAIAGLAGDLLNNGSAIFEMGPANTAMERAVIKRTAGAIGFSVEADGVLTSGGSLGNLTALLAARSAGWVPDDPRPPGFLVSEACHYSNSKALRIMGLEEGSIIPVAVDEEYRIDPDAVDAAMERAASNGVRVIGLIANACTTGTGSYDDLVKLSEFCRERKLWLHVDGAHGVAPVFSKRYRHLLRGLEAADSVVIDFHKMLLAPGLITAVLFREGSDSYRTFSEKASYLWSKDQEREWFDFSKRTLECTKLMMGLKVFAVLKAFGTGLYAEYVDHSYDLAREFAASIQRRGRIELAQQPESNIVCFRLLDRDSSPEELDRLNASIRRKIVDRGDFYVVQVQLRKGLFLRTALMNPFTTIQDLERLLDLVEEVGRSELAPDR
jgi:L-2,4-diaminobutyrate decarboxylase